MQLASVLADAPNPSQNIENVDHDRSPRMRDWNNAEHVRAKSGTIVAVQELSYLCNGRTECLDSAINNK